MLILFLSEVAANVTPLPAQFQAKGGNVGQAKDTGKTIKCTTAKCANVLRRLVAPPSEISFVAPPPSWHLAPVKLAKSKTEANSAEEEDVLMIRFMKNQKEARSVRAQAVSRIAKSALSATVSAVEAKISAKAALAAAASAAARGVAEAIGGHQLIPIPVPVDENPQSYQYPNLYDQNVGNQYPLHTWIAQTYLNVDSIATVSFLVGSGTTFIVLKLRRVLVMTHEKPLLAG